MNEAPPKNYPCVSDHVKPRENDPARLSDQAEQLPPRLIQCDGSNLITGSSSALTIAFAVAMTL